MLLELHKISSNSQKNNKNVSILYFTSLYSRPINMNKKCLKKRNSEKISSILKYQESKFREHEKRLVLRPHCYGVQQV